MMNNPEFIHITHDFILRIDQIRSVNVFRSTVVSTCGMWKVSVETVDRELLCSNTAYETEAEARKVFDGICERLKAL